MIETRDKTFTLYNAPRNRTPQTSSTSVLTQTLSPDFDLEIGQFQTRPANDVSTVVEAVEEINGGSEERQSAIPDPLVDPPTPPIPREYFVTLAKWKGRVMEVNGSTFRAYLHPVIGDQTEKVAEIYVEDISIEDRQLIQNGAAFYWSVGYLDRPSGRIRASLLRFSRVPPWSPRDINTAKEQANSYLEIFDSDK